MAKKVKQRKNTVPEQSVQKETLQMGKRSDYLWSMSYAPRIDENIHGFQLLPITFFTAFVIMMVRMVSYTRPMEQFYWSGGDPDLVDFFSYCKMVAILICAILAIVYLLYRLFTQSLAIQKSALYVPMGVYAFFVILSYVFSDHKEFALLGWNDRFEGTLVLLAYMTMLFYIINSIKTERAVKYIIYPLAVTSALLSLLGVTQALDHDFFRTTIGKMLITPKIAWDNLDTLRFTFQNKEIYQTVYNINYVSFYLTLLIPVFGMLFIRSIMKGKEESLWKKIVWGALFGLLIFNLIGSASSGGFFGLGIIVLLALILLNKRIVAWGKPLAILVVITIIIGGVTYDRWMPELTATFDGVFGAKTEAKVPGTPENESIATEPAQHHIDYINVDSENHVIKLGIEGNGLTFTLAPDRWPDIVAKDLQGQELELIKPNEDENIYRFADSRFSMCQVYMTEDSGKQYFMLITDEQKWVFLQSKEGVYFRNDLGHLVELNMAPAIGWENNQGFGSGRGYIWSRTLPMMKETVLIGHGADTYCLYFPHNDYVGKYNAGWNINLIVDKPHNLYMGMAVGTGLISVAAFLAMLVIYVVQSFKIYWRRNYDSFIDYAGVGICLGIVGFAMTGFVDDSTVSVMPMFYGLLGTGIAINMILKRSS